MVSRLQVIEQVGKQMHLALDSKNAQLFSLRDESGGVIDIDPQHVQLGDAHVHDAKANAVDPALLSYINRTGSYRWPNTPATCHEEALREGDVVTVRGQVILPLPGQMQPGDTELRITAREASLFSRSPWKGRHGRTLLYALLTLGVSLPAALACVVWANL